MELTFEQIRSCTAGALFVQQETDGIGFYKMTPKQTDAWYCFSETLGQRSLTNTGVSLDLHTDSTSFEFQVATTSPYELYVNGVLWERFASSRMEEADCRIRVRLPEGEKRIGLVFPSHNAGGARLLHVKLEDGASFTPHSFKRKLLILGDSITQGRGSEYDSLSYAWRVTRFFDANSIIQGMGGGFHHHTLFDEDLPWEPEWIIEAYGTNDWGRYKTLEELDENVGLYLDKLVARYPNKKIFAITPLWRADAHIPKAMGLHEACCQVLKEQYSKHGCIVVDGSRMTPGLPEFFMDGLHPNEWGHSIFAENLIKEICKHI